jgi:membrane-bound ClpP family serine protease
LTDPEAKQDLDHAFAVLERQVPEWLARVIRWVRDPDKRRIRLAIGILCIGLSFFFWLPVIGIELLPIGLLLIAIDVPLLRKPVALSLLWMLRKWVALRTWLQALKQRGAAGPN